MNNKNSKELKGILEKITNIEKELGNIKFEIFKNRPFYYLKLPVLDVKKIKRGSIIEKTAGIIKSKADIEEIVNTYEESLFQSGLGK